MSLITPHGEEVQLIVKALGLPENLISFTIHCDVESLLTVECTYYPESKDIAPQSLDAISKKFTLVAIDESQTDKRQ